MTSSSKRAVQVAIVRHASLVLLIGFLAGFFWAFALLGEVKISPIPITFVEGIPGDPDRWRIVHLGSILNALMAFAFSAALELFAMTSNQARKLKLAALAAIWGNVVFYVFTVFAPNHGLSLGDNAVGQGNLAGAIGYLGAMIAAFGAIYVAVCLLRFARQPSPEGS